MIDISPPLPMPASAPAAESHARSPIRKELTPVAIEKMRPRAYRFEVGDGRAQGLRLAVSPSGHKSFIVRFRFAGKPKKYTIGPVTLGLKAARAEAAKIILQVAQGNDPTLAKREKKEEQRLAALAVEDTFYSVSERFLKLEGPKLRSADTRRKTFERLIYPEIGSRPIADVRRSELTKLLDRVEQNNGPAAAHLTLAFVRRMMSWHAARSDDFRSPVVRGMGRINSKETARSRTLSDDELRRLWRAAEETEGPYGRLVQFLLLTGARRNEAAQMRWAELNGADWLLPPQRNKTKVPLLRPLSKAAMETIGKLPRINDTFVFASGAGAAFAGFSKAKTLLDQKSGVTGWRVHDLRRTARTLLSRAGVRSEDAERCLGHVLGGIEGVYNKHSYHTQMQKSFEALAATIEKIISPPPEGKVIEMKRG
jgi:integrase